MDIPAYNGGLFAEDEVLNQLIVADDLCQEINELAKYDFDSEVSVTVLGHIFEQSIADLETLTEQISGGELPQDVQKTKAVSGKRKREGVVYTPDHITAFIVEHTLGSHIEEKFQNLLNEYGKFKKDGSIQWKKGKKTELKFWYAWQEVLQTIKVVDPACGSGAFLIAAFDYLHAEYQRINDKLAEITGQHSVFDLNKTILNTNLYGVDINPESIEISKLSLWLKTAERGKSLTTLGANLLTGNSLGYDEPAPGSDFCWQEAFPEIMKQGGFDVVLSNPPYVRQELLSNIKPWLEEHYDVYHGVVDLYAYFFELGHRLLKPRGRMGYISSSTFFKTSSGERLRRYLVENSVLKTIVGFGDLQVFEGVTTYPAIVMLQKGLPASDHKLDILVLNDELPNNLSLYFSQNAGLMAQSQLTNLGWQLEDEQLGTLRQKLTSGYPTLKEVYGSPLYGIKTGLNAAFVIDRATHDRLIKQDAASAELLKPFLEGKDLKKWHAQPRELWLVFTRRGVDIERYPVIKAYLDQFREHLEPKPKSWVKIVEKKKWPTSKPSDWPDGYLDDWPSEKPDHWKEWKWPGRKTGPYQWYEIQDTVAYYESFEEPKIQYAHFNPSPLFHFNTNGHYSNDKSYIIPSGDFYLYGLLNSKCYWFLIKAMCPFVRGGYYELRIQYIETLPVVYAGKEQKILVAKKAEEIQSCCLQRYSIEGDFRRRLPDLCPTGFEPKLNNKLKAWWELDFKGLQSAIKTAFKTDIPLVERNQWQDYFEVEQSKIMELNQQIATLESELNQAVYALFKLSDEEIALVEENVK